MQRRRVWQAVGLAAAAVVLLAVVFVALVRPFSDRTDSGTDGGAGDRTVEASVTPTDGGPAGGAAPSGEAMPVGNLPGWRQVMAEDFAGTALPRSWDAYSGQPQGDPGGYFDPSRVQVGGGLLTLGAWRDPARGLYVTGGVSSRGALSSTYGRYDVRFRMDQGVGIAYAILLWPQDNVYPPEIDFAEDNGRDRSVMYGSVHPADGSTSVERQVDGDFSQWHTAGVQWTPGLVVYTVDGQEWGRVTGSVVPSEPMALALQTQAWFCGHSWEACPDDTTPDVVNLQIDWVVAYARS